ncbi:MAG: DNA polymerase III subunit gamma/tau [Clostridia bacterium]|nr:DNA polymerase III subunit gamma/tau [Clostridia bacterium]
MSYLSLYRRFRPTSFDKVIGQDAIVKTLQNQITANRIGHAYLFTGARGTGKTTVAKIFAKAVNCLNSVNGSPCGECLACKSLLDPSNIDVIEMDAASNNKVENVREIRENVQYPPVNVKFKVYIIDEVHMLTSEAFNALLKTLEEPPKHAIFILATTEPHKIPATILSRCMRFDFRLVSTKTIASLIKGVYDEIQKKYTEEAVMAIAKAGEGSVRDALSVADLCVSVGGNNLTYNDVITVLGATDSDKIDSLVSSMLKGNASEVLRLAEELYFLGKSIAVLSKDIINYLRDLLVVKMCAGSKDILALPQEKLEIYKNTASLCDEHRILRILEIMSQIESQLRYSNQPRAVFETALIKSALPQNDYNIDALLARVKALEEKLSTLESGSLKIQPIVEPKEKVEVKVTEPKITVEEPKPIIVEPKVEMAEPIKAEVVEPKLVQEEVKIVVEKVESVKPNLDGKRIFGMIVRRLRTIPNCTILWVALQEMSASVNGSTLYINASEGAEYSLVSKSENLAILCEIAKEFGIEDIKVVTNGAQENGVEEVKNFFGSTLINK